MIDKLIERYKEILQIIEKEDRTKLYKNRTYPHHSTQSLKMVINDLEELKVEIDKLAKDKNFFENYYYDDMFAKGKISKELYAKFKGLGVDIDE